MQYVLSRYVIKVGKLEETKQFLRHLHDHHASEMRDVLSEAGMDLDCSFIEDGHGREILYIFKRLKCIGVLKEKILNSQLPIYTDIRRWATSCLEDGHDIVAIAAFDRDSRDS